jgi:FtsP/CotA-like multicopper oxidase with cupredoxin domain
MSTIHKLVGVALLGCVAVVSSGSASAQLDERKYNIPTGANASPLFGAQPFSQKMLMFEEFGTRNIPTLECATCKVIAPPPDCNSSPVAAKVDAAIAQRLFPMPTREANVSKPNPWYAKVGECIGRTLATSAIEGRPPGEMYSHQRWDEFAPKTYFQSVQAGARSNGGVRDKWQMHHYTVGEFGPGGLYHNTAGAPGFDGTTKGMEIKLHPKMPVQSPNSVWTFDGTLPPKLLMARYGQPILFRHYNGLPISVAANGGFGNHLITTHEHNGHNPAESDGFAGAYFYPGQYYDYRWPMQLAGRDSINVDATDPRAGMPNGAGGVTRIRGDWRETMSTHWFHDHMIDFTAQNVYKGNAAMMNYYSAVDRGREGFKCHYANANNANLCLPSGTGLDWGNRDYDVNLLIADKAWDKNGQLFFNIFNKDGFLGDQMTVNWSWKPYMDVRARKYRFRLLNGSVSRYFKIAIVTAKGERVPFYMIANDGNIMEHAVPFPNAESKDLPTQAIAERFDIVVDFSKYPVGTKIYFVNTLEHRDGAGPKDEVDLREILSGKYSEDGDGDPAVGKFMEFRVQPYAGQDLSMNPADYVEGKKKMIPRPVVPAADLSKAKRRTFEFGHSGGTDEAPWTIKTDGGNGMTSDIHRVSAAPEMGQWEIWRIESSSGGWSHPVHIHFEEGQILTRDGKPPPIWEKWARKDVYRVGPEPDGSSTVEVAIRFREFAGSYVEHCHNTQHEDHSMLLRWDVLHPGQTVAVPTPEGAWEGMYYEPTFVLPTWRTGSGTGPSPNAGTSL